MKKDSPEYYQQIILKHIQTLGIPPRAANTLEHLITNALRILQDANIPSSQRAVSAAKRRELVAFYTELKIGFDPNYISKNASVMLAEAHDHRVMQGHVREDGSKTFADPNIVITGADKTSRHATKKSELTDLFVRSCVLAVLEKRFSELRIVIPTAEKASPGLGRG
jgi:hypothetical protein